MELRPELMPPALHEALVARLVKLADRLSDWSRQCDDELTEFNQLAGTDIPLAEFQGIYGCWDSEYWVRWVLYRARIKPVPGVTRAELAEVVRRAMMPENEFLGQHEAYMMIFDANVPLQNASNLIFYPPDYDPVTHAWCGRATAEYDPSPEQIVE